MKKLLIVVDYQNDFVNGALGFSGAEKLDEKLVKRIKEAEQNNEDIIFTKDIHEDNYLESEEGKNLPVKHCLSGSSGAELFGEVKDCQKDYKTFEKGAFGSLELGNYLANENYEQITVVGLVSYICVLSNAVICKAALPNAHIIVEKDLTDALDKKAQEIGFEALKNIHIEIK